MLLIVNADDLGGSEAINDEIFALMGAGLVTSATLMANAPAFEHAVDHISRFPNCSFGVHLNLTAFPPLSRLKNLEPVLRNGELSRDLLTKQLLTKRLSRELRNALEQELIMQVQRVVDSGIPVTHLDSHHFIHARVLLFPVVKAVQRHFGIRKVRPTLEVLSEVHLPRTVKRRLFDYTLRKVYTTVSPNGWCEFRRFHAALVRNALPRFRCLELMVHPGSGNARYEEEIAILRSNWQQLLPADVQLGSYRLLSSV
jgi:chitin disaccharide deacetylase